jgi:hypothetical protein
LRTSWLKRIALWFSPRDRFIAQQQTLGKSQGEIDTLPKLHDAQKWLATPRRQISEDQNPPPRPTSTFTNGRWEEDWLQHRRDMTVYQAEYEDAMAEEDAALQE